MGKLAHTQHRYAKANRNQMALTCFGFATAPVHPQLNPQFWQRVSSPSKIDGADTVDPLPVIPCHRSSSILSDPVMSEAEMTSGSDAEAAGDDKGLEMNEGEGESQFSADTEDAEIQTEYYEDELDENVCGPADQVKSWDKL